MSEQKTWLDPAAAERLRSRLRSSGITQARMARELSMNPSDLSKILGGTLPLDDDFEARFLQAFRGLVNARARALLEQLEEPVEVA